MRDLSSRLREGWKLARYGLIKLLISPQLVYSIGVSQEKPSGRISNES